MSNTALASEIKQSVDELKKLAADRDVPVHWELLRKPFTREDLAGAILRVLR